MKWSKIFYLTIYSFVEWKKNACLYIFTYPQQKCLLKNDYFHLQKYPLFTVILLTLYLAVKNMFISKNSCFSITFIHAEWCLSSNDVIDYIWSIYKVLFNKREKRGVRCLISVQDSESEDVTWNPYSISFYSNFVFDFSEARISSIIYTYFSDFFGVRHLICFSNLFAVFHQSQILASFTAQWKSSEFQKNIFPGKTSVSGRS